MGGAERRCGHPALVQATAAFTETYSFTKVTTVTPPYPRRREHMGANLRLGGFKLDAPHVAAIDALDGASAEKVAEQVRPLELSSRSRQMVHGRAFGPKRSTPPPPPVPSAHGLVHVPGGVRRASEAMRRPPPLVRAVGRRRRVRRQPGVHAHRMRGLVQYLREGRALTARPAVHRAACAAQPRRAYRERISTRFSSSTR